MLNYFYLLLAVGLIELFLGIWLLIKYQRSAINTWYGLFIFSVAAWVFSNAGLYLSEYLGNNNSLFLFNQLTWLAGVVLTCAFLFFSFVFPFSQKPIKKWAYLLFLIPLTLFSFLVFFTDNFQTDILIAANSQRYVMGDLFYLFPPFFFVYWIWSITNLAKKYQAADGIHKWQIKYLLIGIIVSLLIIIGVDIIPITFGWKVINGVGEFATLIWLFFTSYIILKKP
ncbi:hypothetical protein KKI23_01045 [Patescibacteria group bacterium]|nr:hypothetical protein [Patescibacteria group bacterium]